MPTLTHPYGDLTGGQWLRGNLHAHTTRSDGSRPPQAVIDDYANRGYGYLMISDHDIFTSEADYKEWNPRGMVLICGNEISRNGPHMLHVDGDRFINPCASRQQTINDVLAAAKESGRGFAVVNHPNWQAAFDHCTISQMREWVGYVGLEIYNGIITRLDGSPYATNKWDMLLSDGRRVWGFANDDSHSELGVEMGWNTTYVKDRSAAGIADALRNGRFYCSTGVTIKSIKADGLRIRIETADAQRIAAIRDIGQRFAVVEAPTIEVEVPRGAKYVRFECWGAGEKMAWTQPFFIDQEVVGGSAQPTGMIAQWRTTALVPGLKIEQATLQQAAKLPSTPHAGERSNDQGLLGFADCRAQFGGKPGVVYLSTDIASETDRRGTLFLGYDGPVRVWLNEQQLFEGPGSNPAIPDRVQVYAPFKRGTNKLVIAVDSNGGRAWGLFARVE